MHRRGFVNVDKTDALARGSSPFKLASEASSAGGLPPAFDAAVVFTSADYGHLEVAEEDATAARLTDGEARPAYGTCAYSAEEAGA